MRLYCCGCGDDVSPRLTDGSEVYPHRIDLYSLPFWKCDTCGNFVGCHHKTKDRTRPLGCIPTREIKQARIAIHDKVDPLWRSGKVGRAKLYKMISREIGRQYHTANIRSMEEASQVFDAVNKIREGLQK